MKRFLPIILFCLWALYSQTGHIVYFTHHEFKPNDVVHASDFFVLNQGYFVKGIYQPMWWGNPQPNGLAIDPIDKTPLIFDSKYLVKVCCDCEK